jgi:hemerythrin
MTNAKPSVFLTYVTYSDDIAHEHTRLFTHLKNLVVMLETGALPTQCAAQLSEFLVHLESHHATENAILQVVCPVNMQVHVSAHVRMTQVTKDLLQSVQVSAALDFTKRLRDLIKMLHHHVATLDHELAAIVNGDNHAQAIDRGNASSTKAHLP